MITAEYIRELQHDIAIKKSVKEFVEIILNDIEKYVKNGGIEEFLIKKIDARMFYVLGKDRIANEFEKLGFKIDMSSELKTCSESIYCYVELKISWRNNLKN